MKSSAPILAALVFPFLCSTTHANPTDGVVTFGAADFSGGDGLLTIRQGTDKAIINWGDFSIRRGEITEFIQPGSSSAVLNRVVTGNPSSIQGALRANGTVLVINPNGILVGPSGTIDVGGSAILSTLDLADEDFLAGGDLLFKGTSDRGIINQGRISAIEGDVFLFSQTVSNQGSISAPNGTVGLGAGTEVLLTAEPDRNGERVFVRAGAGLRGQTGVENTGTIEAAAVELKATGNLYALAINNSGSIRATGAGRVGGKVFLRAPGGAVSNTGSIEATVPGSRGGRILIEANTFDHGGSLETDGDIDLLVNRLNLLPGATIGGVRLGDILAEANDTQHVLNNHRTIDKRRNSDHGAGPLPDGRIIAEGRHAAGPAAIGATIENGRVMIGMTGVSRIQPGLTPRTVPLQIDDAASMKPGMGQPSQINPPERPAVPGSVPADPGKPPVIPGTPAKPVTTPSGSETKRP